MVPELNLSIDNNNNYLITEITLGALTALYTPWDTPWGLIINYKLLHDYGTIGASDDQTFITRGDKSIQFNGKVYDPPLNKEIKIEGEEDKSLFKGTLIHKCSVCEPIYLDVCGDCL